MGPAAGASWSILMNACYGPEPGCFSARVGAPTLGRGALLFASVTGIDSVPNRCHALLWFRRRYALPLGGPFGLGEQRALGGAGAASAAPGAPEHECDGDR